MIILDSMGHLYSDVSVQELYEFAVKKLKLKPEWNHYGRHFPHFDLTTKKMKDRAISLGALFVDVRDDFERYDRCRKMYRQWHLDNCNLCYWYDGVGLHGQKILRINFERLGIK